MNEKLRISRILLASVVASLLTGCEDLAAPSEPKEVANECVFDVDSYHRTDTNATPWESIFDIEFLNNCVTGSVKVRVSNRLVDLKYVASEAGQTLDHVRYWVDINPGYSSWLCRAGPFPDPHCRFPASLGDGMRYNWRACFIGEECPWPTWPQG